MTSATKQETYKTLIKVHRDCIEKIKLNDFNGFNKLVREELKEKVELLKLNKLRLILLASKSSEDVRVHQVRTKVQDEYTKIVKTYEPKKIKI